MSKKKEVYSQPRIGKLKCVKCGGDKYQAAPTDEDMTHISIACAECGHPLGVIPLLQ